MRKLLQIFMILVLFLNTIPIVAYATDDTGSVEGSTSALGAYVVFRDYKSAIDYYSKLSELEIKKKGSPDVKGAGYIYVEPRETNYWVASALLKNGIADSPENLLKDTAYVKVDADFETTEYTDVDFEYYIVGFVSAGTTTYTNGLYIGHLAGVSGMSDDVTNEGNVTEGIEPIETEKEDISAVTTFMLYLSSTNDLLEPTELQDMVGQVTLREVAIEERERLDKIKKELEMQDSLDTVNLFDTFTKAVGFLILAYAMIFMLCFFFDKFNSLTTFSLIQFISFKHLRVAEEDEDLEYSKDSAIKPITLKGMLIRFGIYVIVGCFLVSSSVIVKLIYGFYGLIGGN